MILVHLADGFEEVEAVTVTDILRRAGLETKFVSVTGSRQIKGANGITVEADTMFEEADYEACEMIVLPGGMPGALNLKEHKGLCRQIALFAEEDKALAAICAAPMVFGSLGILSGRKATIYPGMEEELLGAEPIPFPVVRDSNIITSQGPGTAMKFAIAIVKYFKGEDAGDKLEKELLLY